MKILPEEFAEHRNSIEYIKWSKDIKKLHNILKSIHIPMEAWHPICIVEKDLILEKRGTGSYINYNLTPASSSLTVLPMNILLIVVMTVDRTDLHGAGFSRNSKSTLACPC